MYKLFSNLACFKIPSLLLGIAITSSCLSTYGQVLYEGFDYAAGSTLGGANGGSGFSAGWVSNNGSGPEFTTDASGSLSVSNLETSGGFISRNNRTNITTIARTLDAAAVSSLTGDGTTLWGSFVYRDGNGDGFNADSSLSLASTSAAIANDHMLSAAGVGVGLAIGEDDADTGGIFYDNVTSPTFGPTTLTDTQVLDATSLFVFSVQWNSSGTDDVLTFYQVTDPSAALPPAFSTTTFDFNSAEQATLNTLNIVEAQTGEFDEIRLGVTLAEVLPGNSTEPPVSDGPNIIYIIVDDMGYSDLGCFGGEIDTPHLDSLATDGISFRQFYNNAKCETTRTSLMSGLYHGRGLNASGGATLAEALKSAGYRTSAVGKWHLGSGSNIPIQQGFDNFYGFYGGSSRYFESGIVANTIKRDTAESGNFVSTYPDSSFSTQTGTVSNQIAFPADYYMTDGFGDNAVTFIDDAVTNHPDKPFFLYLSFNAPHTPLQAPVDLINKYRNNGTYDAGWDVLREEKWERQKALGLIDADWELPALRDDIPQWDSLSASDQDAEIHRRSTYAAMMDSVDQNIGKVLQQLADSGVADDTLVIFSGDNGAQAFDNTNTRQNDPSNPNSLWSMGPAWAAFSNAPYRYYKQSQHQGGIVTPLIARWPGTIAPDTITDQPGHVVDIMATFVDIANVDYNSLTKNDGQPVPPMDGESLLPVFEGGTRTPVEWGFEFGSSEFGFIQGDWKLVSFSSSPWRLYNLTTDRTETTNLRWENPTKVAELAMLYDAWAIDTYGNTSRTYAERDTRGQLSQELRYSRVTGGLFRQPGVDISLSNIGSGTAATMNDHWEFYLTATSAAGITGTSDSVTFANKPLSGDGQLTALVESLSGFASNGTAGVMIRESLNANSPLIMIGVRPDGQVIQSVRSAAGGSVTTTVAEASISLPAFFKITREGDQFTPCYSADLETWTALTPVTLTMNADALGGLSAASGNNSTRGTVTFREWENRVEGSDCPGGLLGDVNQDGTVDFLDISPFIATLSSGQFACEADIDQNGEVNFLDIAPFIALLSGN